MYGTQADIRRQCVNTRFENDVNMYGTQAVKTNIMDNEWFENDVNMYGTQAIQVSDRNSPSLRMM